MHPHPTSCFVLMVHYGDPEETARALSALWQGTKKPARIIIIDHAEEPLDLPHHPQQTSIRPHKNAGYAAGLNIGLGVIFAGNPPPHQVVLCMNNDVLVGPHSLENLLDYFAQNSEPIIVGARWGRIHSMTGRSTLLSTAEFSPALQSALTYIDGAFFASTWAVWLKVQKIPDDYFMYWEESALRAKAHQRGIHFQVLPNLDIEHKDIDKKNHSRERTYYLVRNGAHYMQTHTPAPLRWWWQIYNRLRYLYHYFDPTPHSRLIRQALRDALKGSLGPAKLPKSLL